MQCRCPTRWSSRGSRREDLGGNGGAIHCHLLQKRRIGAPTGKQPSLPSGCLTARALLRLEKPTPNTHLHLTLSVACRHLGQVHLASSSPRVKLAPHPRPFLHDQSRTSHIPLKECTSHDPERLRRYRQAQVIAHLHLESSLQLLVRSAAFDRTVSPRALAVDHVSGTRGGCWLA